MTTTRHEALMAIVTQLPSDFEPHGERSRNTDWGPDCSCGCRWWTPLQGELRHDWGVCTNPDSPRCGLLTFEHQGCHQFAYAGEPADPAAELAGPDDDRASSSRGAEATLLANLRARHAELLDLLEDVSDHWGYEDPVYRFYHHSFKVYALQATIRAIVDRLADLLPDQPLHPWFLAIVDAGTGHRFEPEHNARWTEITRPILEAFFHARFFLDMAVRYATLEEPPNPLPSGYAALLYLYGLR